jgi:hypothetical protein
MLLAQTGAASASDSIRQQIAADNSNQQSADDSFTDQLLFGSSTGTGDAPLDADAEKARLDAAKARTPAPPAAAPVAAQPTPPTPQARVQPAPAAKPSGG